MPGAGDLDRQIILRKAGEITGHNEWNEPIYGPDISLKVWAARHDVSDGEKFAAGQVGATLQSRFTIRSSPNTRQVTPVYDLIHEGATWNIIGIKETQDGRRRFIEITATRDADNGQDDG